MKNNAENEKYDIECNNTSLANHKTYVKGTSKNTIKEQNSRCEMENKFDALINNNCSWSYKSQKIISKACSSNTCEKKKDSSMQIQHTITSIHISKTKNLNNGSQEGKLFTQSETSSSACENYPHTSGKSTERKKEQPKTTKQKAKKMNISNRIEDGDFMPTKLKRNRNKYQESNTPENPSKRHATLRKNTLKNYKEKETSAGSDSSSDEEIFQTRFSLGYLKQIENDKSLNNQSVVIGTDISEQKYNVSDDYAKGNTQTLSICIPEKMQETYPGNKYLEEINMNEASEISLVNAEKIEEIEYSKEQLQLIQNSETVPMTRLSNTDTLTLKVSRSCDEFSRNFNEAFSTNNSETNDLKSNQNFSLKENGKHPYSRESKSRTTQSYSKLKSEIQTVCEELQNINILSANKNVPQTQFLCEEKRKNANISKDDEIIKDFFTGEFMINKYKMKEYQSATSCLPSKNEDNTTICEVERRGIYETKTNFPHENSYLGSNANDNKMKCISNKLEKKNAFQLDNSDYEEIIDSIDKNSFENLFKTNFQQCSTNTNEYEILKPQLQQISGVRPKLVQSKKQIQKRLQHLSELVKRNNGDSKLFDDNESDVNSLEYSNNQNISLNLTDTDLPDKQKTEKGKNTDEQFTKYLDNLTSKSNIFGRKNKRKKILHSAQSEQKSKSEDEAPLTMEKAKDIKFSFRNKTHSKKNLKKRESESQNLHTNSDILYNKYVLKEKTFSGNNSLNTSFLDIQDSTDESLQEQPRKRKYTKSKISAHNLTADLTILSKTEFDDDKYNKKRNGTNFLNQVYSSLSEELNENCFQDNGYDKLYTKFNENNQLNKLEYSDNETESCNIEISYEEDSKHQSVFPSSKLFEYNDIMNEQYIEQNHKNIKGHKTAITKKTQINSEYQKNKKPSVISNEHSIPKDNSKNFINIGHDINSNKQEYILPEIEFGNFNDNNYIENSSKLLSKEKRNKVLPKTWNELEAELLYEKDILLSRSLPNKILHTSTKCDNKSAVGEQKCMKVHNRSFNFHDINDSCSIEHNSEQSNIMKTNKFDTTCIQQKVTKEISKLPEPSKHSNSSILNRTIAAMEACTSKFLSQTKEISLECTELNNITDFDDLSVITTSNINGLIEFHSTLEFTSRANYSMSDQIKEQTTQSNKKSNIEIFKSSKGKKIFRKGNNKNNQSQEMGYLESTHVLTYKQDDSYTSNNTLKRNTAYPVKKRKTNQKYFDNSKAIEWDISTKTSHFNQNVSLARRVDGNKDSEIADHDFMTMELESPMKVNSKNIEVNRELNNVLNFLPEHSNKNKHSLKNKCPVNGSVLNKTNKTIKKRAKARKEEFNQLEKDMLNLEAIYSKFPTEKKSRIQPNSKKQTAKQCRQKKPSDSVAIIEKKMKLVDEINNSGNGNKDDILEETGFEIKSSYIKTGTTEDTVSNIEKKKESNESEVSQTPLNTEEIKTTPLNKNKPLKPGNFTIKMRENGSFTLERYSSPSLSSESAEDVDTTEKIHIQTTIPIPRSELEEKQKMETSKEKYQKYWAQLFENEDQIIGLTAGSQIDFSDPVIEDILETNLKLQENRDKKLKGKLITAKQEELFLISSDSDDSLVSSPKKQHCGLLLDFFDD